MGECLSWGPGWSTEREAQGGCIGASGCYKVMVVGWGAQRGSYSRGHPCHTGMPGHPDRGLTACLWGCQSSRQIGSFKIYNIAWGAGQSTQMRKFWREGYTRTGPSAWARIFQLQGSQSPQTAFLVSSLFSSDSNTEFTKIKKTTCSFACQILEEFISLIFH